MAQRGWLSLRPAVDRFRISKPGIDVKTAAQVNLILDERVFYAQVLETGSINNPGGTYPATASAVITNILVKPAVLLFPLYGNLATPTVAAYVSGIPGVYPGMWTGWSQTTGNLTITFYDTYVTSVKYIVLRVEMP